MLAEECLSPDGMIVDQRKMSGIRYGKYMSDYNGCGWIAAYNACRLMGIACDEEELIARLEKTLLFGGAIGTGFFALRKYFRSRKIRTRVYVGRRAVLRHAPSIRTGIVYYRHARGFHFACCGASQRGFHFYNARYGICRDERRMDSFLKNEVKGAPVLLLSLG